MKTKHTKGEWEYRGDVVGSSYYIETIDKSHVNTFIGDIGGGLQSKEEIEANAKLIAAAPDLLESCIKLTEASKGCKNYREIYMQAFEDIKQAIKKATE